MDIKTGVGPTMRGEQFFCVTMRQLKVQRGIWYNIKNIFSLIKPYKWFFIVNLLIILILELNFLAERYLFKVLVDEGTMFGAGSLGKEAFIDVLIMLGVAFASLIAIRAAFRWIREHIIALSESAMMADLKRKFFNHIIGLSLRFHTTHKTGSLISRLSRGGRAIEDIMDSLYYNVIPPIFQLIIAAISVAYLDLMSSVIIISVFILFITFSIVMEKRRFKKREEANEADDIEKANIGDILTNIDSVKYFAKEKSIEKRYHSLSENTKWALFNSWSYSKWLNTGQTVILGLGMLAIVYFPIKSFLIGEITLGTVVFIYTIYASLMAPLFNFVSGLRSFSQSMADFESLYQYEDFKNEITDAQNARELKIEKGEIEFKKVGFTYQKKKILNNFKLKIKKNEKVALVGRSGSGKSTLIKLLFRMYDTQEGGVFIDGKDIKEFTQESLRSELSIVPQECVLFDDTIYNNILFSRTGASREEVLQAIKFAQLDKVIDSFPEKENTIVGERGVKLSGGEKQRVSIARAILANKKVLVLDEATSSLDSETEHDIQRDLQQLMKGRTSIIIAHRLSTILSADKIVVLEEGKIVQLGTHKQLIRRKGTYRKLWELQKGGYIE